jgi:hypothetical protein
LQPEISDCDADIHAKESACIVTRVVPVGKRKFMIRARSQPSAVSQSSKTLVDGNSWGAIAVGFFLQRPVAHTKSYCSLRSTATCCN